MGRSATGLSRKKNKERKEKELFFKVKKYRRHKLGQEKMKEHNKQQEVVGHNKAILKAKIDALREARRKAGIVGRSVNVVPEVPQVEEPEQEPEEQKEAGGELPVVKVFTGERWVVASPGVIVREGEGLETPQVGRLDHNTLLDLVEVRGRRGRIAAPLKGWVSVTATDGACICQRDYGSDEGEYSDDGLDGDGEGEGEVAEGDEDSDDDDDDESISIDSKDVEVKVTTRPLDDDELDAATSIDSDDSDEVKAPKAPNLKTKIIKTKTGKDRTIVRDRAANKRRKKQERDGKRRKH